MLKIKKEEKEGLCVFKNKRNAKIIAVTVVAFFLLGIVGIVLSKNGNTYAAPSSNIGKVNYARVASEHPGVPEYEKRRQAEIEQAQKDFDEKSKTMNDQQKQEYSNQLNERIALKDQELRAPIFEQIDAAIKAVAEAKKLEVIFDNRSVHYGGIDVTDDVIKKLK